jgi:hypothetical protein
LRRYADSVWFGAVACVLSLSSIGLVPVARSSELDGPPAVALVTWSCSTPALALLNLFIARRDEQAGRRNQARVGVLLSLVAVFVAWVPLLMFD